MEKKGEKKKIRNIFSLKRVSWNNPGTDERLMLWYLISAHYKRIALKYFFAEKWEIPEFYPKELWSS